MRTTQINVNNAMAYKEPCHLFTCNMTSGYARMLNNGSGITLIFSEDANVQLLGTGNNYGHLDVAGKVFSVHSNNVLVISSDPNNVVTPDFSVPGAGYTYYLIQVGRGSVSLYQYVFFTGFGWSRNNCLYKFQTQGDLFCPPALMNFYFSGTTTVLDDSILEGDVIYVKLLINGVLINYATGYYLNLLNKIITINSPSGTKCILLSKESDSLKPLTVREFNNLSAGTVYPMQCEWHEIHSYESDVIILYILQSSTRAYNTISSSLRPTQISTYDTIVNYNPSMIRGKGVDINNIRTQFFQYVTIFDIKIKNSGYVTIKELWLDSITEWDMTFGAWTDPERGTGTYRKVAKVSMIGSAYNANFIDWKIEPLNDSGLYGYMQTTRAFFNYFYQHPERHWTSDGSGTDLFCHFNIDNLAVEIIEETDNYVDLENKGLLPRQQFEQSPYIGKIETLSRIADKSRDVTIILSGDSIATNGGYTSSVSDAAYRPPRADELCMAYHIEDQLRWRGQQYRRGDAKTEPGGNTDMFTETGTGTTKYYDLAWDWIRGESEGDQASNWYKLWTRVLTGTNCSVTFTVPAGTKRFAFIYRTDYLCAATTSVVMSGNNIAKIINSDGTKVEANGYTFSMKEEDRIDTYRIPTSDGSVKESRMRKSRGQVRLDFVAVSTSSAITVTIQNSGSGRLNYWGVEYSPYEYMLRFINMSRGGHNIAALRCFESWDIDAFKPDLFIFSCPIINEGAGSSISASTPNTPEVFAKRFTDYFTDMKNKSYSPEIIPYVLYIGVQANIVNQSTGAYVSSYINNYGPVDTYRYVGVLDEKVRENNNNVFLNLFNDYDEIAYRKAKLDGTNNIWTSAIQGSGTTGSTFTVDNVHLNDYGTQIGYRIMKRYFNV